MLSGGGARGAYQAGVLRALFELGQELERNDLFKIITGASAGAINAAFLAAHCENLDSGTSKLCQLWQNLHSDDVFSNNFRTVAMSASRLIQGLSFGGLNRRLRPSSMTLLDTGPLRSLLERSIPFEKIQANIESKNLEAVCISATDYSSALGITFVQDNQVCTMWNRSRRISIRSVLTIDHVMASSSIPVFFPPAKIENRDYGDGCLRNQAPLSPAIHLGANRLLVIGVRASQRLHLENTSPMQATLGRIIGVIINAIFMDAIDTDLERLHVINQAIGINADPHGPPGLRPVYPFYLRPSQDLAQIAFKHKMRLPKVFRYLMAGLGSPEETSDILSFLLFDPEYCSELVDLGYRDTRARAGELELFFGPSIKASSIPFSG